MGPGSVSAFTRVFDALWAGTTPVFESAAPNECRDAPTDTTRIVV